jgi:DNA-binding CsgD family transcriptional regulator
MGHLLIVLFNLVLIEGAVVSIYLFLQRKSLPFDFIRDIVRMLFLINGFALLRLVNYYLKQNLDVHAASERIWKWVFPAEALASFIILFLLAYHFLRIAAKLLNRAPSPRLLRVLFGLLWGATLFFGMALALFLMNGSTEMIFAAKKSSNILGMLVMTCALVHLAVEGHRLSDSATSRIALSFAYPLLFIVAAVLLLILRPHKFDIHILAILIFLANAFVFAWFRCIFLKHVGPPSDRLHKAAILHAIAQHRLSKREGEILELLLQGKENREIEELLFISIRTVKNHVHHIFRKMGVRSRAQLVRKIKSG